MADSRTYLCEITKVDPHFLVSLKNLIATKIKGEFTEISEKKKKKSKGHKTLFELRNRKMSGSVGVAVEDGQLFFVGNNHLGQHSYLKRTIIMIYMQKLILQVFKEYGFELLDENERKASLFKRILAGDLQIKMHINYDNDKVNFEYEGGNVRFNIVILEIREILEEKGFRMFQPGLWI